MSKILRLFLATSKKLVNAGARVILRKNSSKPEPDVEAGVFEEVNNNDTEYHSQFDSSIEICLSSSQYDSDNSSIEIISVSSISGYEKLASYQSELGFSSLSSEKGEIMRAFMKQLADEIDRANLSQEQLEQIKQELQSTVRWILTNFKQDILLPIS